MARSASESLAGRIGFLELTPFQAKELCLVTVPFQLVGLIEMPIQQLAASLGLSRPVPLVLHWMIMMEGGGRWALPIAAALACAVVARNIERIWWHDKSSQLVPKLGRVPDR